VSLRSPSIGVLSDMYLLLIADRGGGYGGGRDDYGGGGGYGGGGYGGGGCETMRCTEMAAVLSRAARIRTKYTYIYICMNVSIPYTKEDGNSRREEFLMLT